MSDEEEPMDENEEASASDEEGEGAEGDEEEGGSKKLLIIIAGAVLLLGGGGAAAYFTGMLDSVLGGGSEATEGDHGDGHGDDGHGGGHEAADDGHGDDGHGGGHGDDGHGGGHGDAFLEIPTMIVNLNTDDGTPRYLRLTVQLELANEADRSAVEGVIPRVVDQFQTYLRELRVRDLRGSAGIYRLQMELLWRVNQAAAPVEVKDVLFQEILIQ